MSLEPKTARRSVLSLAQRLRKVRTDSKMSLDDLARRANVSKTYLWELERDESGEKRPSADVLLRIANALSVTIADLLALATVQVDDVSMELSSSLQEFRDRMRTLKTPLSDSDLRDLAAMRFRGGQPQTADEWHQLFLALGGTNRRKQ